MVDLTLFNDHPDKNYSMRDSLNRRTGRLPCYFLEWTGWYSQSRSQRLLGHYRLYQVYKKDPDHIFRRMPLAESYILHYQSSHNVKYFISQIVSFIYCIGTFGRHYLAVEIETFNRSLIKHHGHILKEFLNYAEEDFTSALLTAMEQLNEITLFNPPINHSTHMFFRFQQQYQHQHDTGHQAPAPAIAPPETIPPTGKQKGAFSKKQILILFDLLSQAAHLEKIDLSKPNKYEVYAELLYAINGKSITSWIQELNDYKHKDLYEFHTQGELNQLIATLSNLSERFRKAGLRAFAALADKKIRELEQRRRDN